MKALALQIPDLVNFSGKLFSYFLSLHFKFTIVENFDSPILLIYAWDVE